MKRRCPGCGAVLGPTANFCRACGTRYAEAEAGEPAATQASAATDQRAVPRSERSRVAFVAGGIILVVGAGVAAAILLSAGGGSSTTTVVRSAGAGGQTVAAEETAGEIEPGRYVQAGSFQTLDHAETERQRLAAQGIEVEVVSSNAAQELYPGFQVLLGGPIESHAAEAATLAALHRNGVPSAFARELTPATGSGNGEAVAGRWRGQLERTNPDHPGLDQSLTTTLTIDQDGNGGSLDIPGLGCNVSLSLTTSAAGTFDYDQEPACAGAQTAWIRLSGGELMVTLPSPASNSFSLGTLNRD